jgi:hypothetical protein
MTLDEATDYDGVRLGLSTNFAGELFSRGHEPISTARNGGDVAGIFWAVAQDLSHREDCLA